MKKCPQCKEIKSRDEFHINNSRYDGLQNRCKECKSEYDKIWRLKNPGYEEGRKRTNKKKCAPNPVKVKAKNAARVIKIKKPCEICGSNKNIHKHHEDYSNPLRVNFLCHPCHSLWHQLLNEWEIQNQNSSRISKYS